MEQEAKILLPDVHSQLLGSEHGRFLFLSSVRRSQLRHPDTLARRCWPDFGDCCLERPNARVVDFIVTADVWVVCCADEHGIRRAEWHV